MAKKKTKTTKAVPKKQPIQPARHDYVLVMAAFFSFLAVFLMIIAAFSFGK